MIYTPAFVCLVIELDETSSQHSRISLILEQAEG